MLTKSLGTFFALFAAFLVSAPAQADENAYEVGQVWAYETAPGDEGSLILIQEVDQIGPEDDPMTVYHITMIGVAVSWLSEPIEVAHLPVSAETLDASVTGLVDSDVEFPDYRAGKQIWEDDNGGVFTITLAEITDFLRDLLGPQIRHQSFD